MSSPILTPGQSVAPLSKTLSGLPENLQEIYAQIGVLSGRLGTAEEQESDFAEVRRLLHTYTNCLQPFCVSPKLRATDMKAPPGERLA